MSSIAAQMQSLRNRWKGKADTRAVREANSALVLELIRREGTLTRSDLARRSLLAKPTVSAIVDSLIAQDLVREVGPGASRLQGGPRGMLLDLNPDAAAFVGIHLAVGRTSLAVADARGRVRETVVAESYRGEVGRALNELPHLVRDIMTRSQLPRDRLRGVGVALPGLVDHRTGECVLAPNLGWRGVPVRAALNQALEAPVVVRNSTQAGAIAEARLGAGAAARSFAWVYVGTGIGSAIVMDGRVVQGKRGYTGELGHWQVVPDGPVCKCGRRGCLETVASDFAMEAAANSFSESRAGAEPAASARGAAAIAAAATQGDEPSRVVVARAGEYLGIAISYLINLLDLERVILDGPAIRAGAYFLETIRASVEAHALDSAEVRIVASSVDNDVMLKGAVFLAMDGELADRVVPGSDEHG